MTALRKLDIHEDDAGWRVTIDGDIMRSVAYAATADLAMLSIAAVKATAEHVRRDNAGCLYWPDKASAAHALVAARRAAGVMP